MTRGEAAGACGEALELRVQPHLPVAQDGARRIRIEEGALELGELAVLENDGGQGHGGVPAREDKGGR
jgi:hypothetical protein